MAAQLDAMRRAAIGTSVHVMDRDSIDVGGIRFLGATLWTDFALPIESEGDAVSTFEETDIARALATANRGFNDFQRIEVQAPAVREQRPRSLRRLLTAEDTLARHWVDRDWLRRELEITPPGARPTVVVTHHAPHRKSVADRYRKDWLTPAFVTDLPSSFFNGEPIWVEGLRHYSGGPALWVHGHTHTSFDYACGNCRVIANPRGYRCASGAFENEQFGAGFVVALP